MSGLLTITILITLTGLLAMGFGVDSRDGQDWRRRPGQWRPSHRPARRAEVSWMPLQRTPRVHPSPAPGAGEAGSSRPRSVRGAA